MNDIDKLLEERGKIHGDAETTHMMALDLWNTTEAIGGNDLSDASRAMLFLIMVKIARGIQHPEHADHWRDIAGYAKLIERVECPKADNAHEIGRGA